jgi:predicted membrane-bound mannosyltransferase
MLFEHAYCTLSVVVFPSIHYSSNPSTHFFLPLSVEVCTPVSETGRAGALPAAAANLIDADFNKEQTPGRIGVLEWRSAGVMAGRATA